MNLLRSLLVLTVIAALSFFRGQAAPTSVRGDSFTLVATNASDIQLYGLTSDAQGNIYTGNNDNSGSGISLQRFRPTAFTGSPTAFEDVGPICRDGDGLAFGAGYIYVADSSTGIRKVSVTDGSASVFAPGIATTMCGSAMVFRPSDGHLFSIVSCQSPQIQELDPAGQILATYATSTGVQTMTFDAQSGLIYYASYPDGQIHAYEVASRTDTLIATINGSIDGGLAVDRISNQLFIGTANGADQGKIYAVDLTTHAVSLFASGFDGCLGILREPVSGDLYFLESHSLYRIESRKVVFPANLTIQTAVQLTWFADSGTRYQLQSTTDPTKNIWADFGAVIQGDGATHSVFDTTLATSKKFYRVTIAQ